VPKSPRRPAVPISDRVPMGPWKCDVAAYERIIEAVGAPYAVNVDRDRLISDLLTAREKLLGSFVLDSDRGAGERKELFGGILDSAIAFKDRLLDDRGHKYAAREIASRFEGPSFEAFIYFLDRTIEAAKALKDENSCGGWVRLERPPKEWFVAEVLPQVFEANFKRKAKISHPSDSRAGTFIAGGPYIRFAVAVMREMGISVSEETVARALKQVRAGRARRKPRSTTVTRPSDS
jgi:hypothetical protein